MRQSKLGTAMREMCCEELDFQAFKSSSSTRALFRQYQPSEEVSSWEMVQWILRTHTYFGSGLAKRYKDETGPRRYEIRSARRWIEDLEALFNPERLKEIRARHVILGLSKLDRDLREYLSALGLLQAISAEKGTLGGDFETLVRSK